jgi:hypothetical protein
MKTSLIFALLFLASACASKRTYNSTAWSEKDEGGVGLQVEWVKNKGDTLDVSFAVYNRYPFEIVIPENSLQCEVDGESTHSNRTNRRMVVPAHGKRVSVAVFEYGKSTRNASSALFALDRIHRGEETTETISETTSTAHSFGSAKAVRNGNTVTANGSGFAIGKSKSTSYQALGFKEGDRLPSAKLTLPLSERAPAGN